MDKSLNRLIRWFCRRITLNELASIVVVLFDILSGKNKDFELKPEIENKSANYRKFTLTVRRKLPADRGLLFEQTDQQQADKNHADPNQFRRI